MADLIMGKLYNKPFLTWGSSNLVMADDKSKAEHKNLNPLEFIQKVLAKEKTFEMGWDKNLSHQMKSLPKFKDVWRDTNKQFRKLEKIK